MKAIQTTALTTTKIAATGATLLAAAHWPAILLTAGISMFSIIAGVILPAVWFNCEHRRRDSRLVLQQILDALIQPRSRGSITHRRTDQRSQNQLDQSARSIT